MSVFGHYARYYDLLYRDKDYPAEANYVHHLIQRYAPQARRILEFGSGTGMHAWQLAALGYTIKGVELSAEMVAIARDRAPELAIRQGDIRDVRLGELFDVVIALFHVVSYQTSNRDLHATFASAKAHLKPGGLFLFDCWYGPAVLTDRPVVRVKRMEDEVIRVLRIAEPQMHSNENRVDVRYSLLILDKQTGQLTEMQETHRMRYLFRPEIEYFLKTVNIDLIACEEWLSGRNPGFDTWSVCFLASNQFGGVV